MMREEMKDKIPINPKTPKPQSIETDKLLMVEGESDKTFFGELFDKKGIQGIQIISVGGKNNFNDELSAIVKLPDFQDLKSLAILRDADQSAESAFKSLCSTLKKNDLPVPLQSGTFVTNNSLQVGVFIIPDGNNQGMLESLCLSIVKKEGKGIIKCVDSFMECVKELLPQGGNTYKPPKNWDKARFRAFLSAMEEDTPSLGVATQKGYWDLDSDKLDPVFNFLKKL